MNDLSWTSDIAGDADRYPILVVGRRAFFARVARVIRGRGASARWADTEARAWRSLNRTAPALVILDGGLATPTDFSLCARLAASAGCPVLMVAATDDEVDRILALELGADDCVSAGCTPREMLARIKVRLRHYLRSRQFRCAVPPTISAFGEWRMDLVAKRVLCPDGRWVELRAAEGAILQRLVARAGSFVSLSEIAEAYPGRSKELNGNHLRVQVSRLRKKLGRDSRGQAPIACVRLRGYRVPAPPEMEAVTVSDSMVDAA